MHTSYHEILGVSESATIEEIKEIYKKLCLIYHPDKSNGGVSSEKFIHIKEAYEALIDDRQINFIESPTIERDLEVSLEDLMVGCTKFEVVNRLRPNEDSKTFEIAIKPGLVAGTRILFHAEGNIKNDGKTAGDLIFTLKEKPHPFFLRDANNIICIIQISLYDALQGCRVSFRTLTGSKISFTVEVPKGFQVEGETTFIKIFKGHGFPVSQSSKRRGDLLANVTIIDAVFVDSFEDRYCIQPLDKDSGLRKRWKCHK
jgi:DnaJ-class molecular chaperone